MRALIVSLKYCGNTSEPKIGEFLENFDVQVSAGSLSNILTRSANLFEQDYDDLLIGSPSTDKTYVVFGGDFDDTSVIDIASLSTEPPPDGDFIL